MSGEQRTLPDFDDPPIVETALSVEFATLAKWRVPHFGLFWHEIHNDYDRFEVQSPLASQVEKFGIEARIPQTLKAELLLEPPVRCWFISKSDTRLIQVQNDRFVHNWRKAGTAEGYPHYENIRPTFEREWTRFCAFLESNSIGRPDVRQCEITYVNHIEPGKAWNTLADLPNVLACWSGTWSGDFLATPEVVAVNAAFVIPNNRGRLHISLQPAVRHADAKEILQLTLTARGKPAAADTASILNWFDLGREWIVRGFTDFTSTKMHKLWKRKQ